MTGARFASFLLGAVLALPCLGTETIYLKNGFQLEVQSHTVDDGTIIVRTASGGTLEFPEKLVDRIVKVETTASVPPGGTDTAQLLKKAANGEGLEPELVKSVAKIESGWRQNAVSAKGAVGLMQLMPGTAAELGANPEQANSNAWAGAKYLRELLLRYDGSYALALAAYNAGPGAVAKYNGVPPYAETVNYVRKVLREYKREKATSGRPSVKPQT